MHTAPTSPFSSKLTPESTTKCLQNTSPGTPPGTWNLPRLKFITWFLNVASILPRWAWFSPPPRFEATFDYTFSLDPSIQSAGSVGASTCFFLSNPPITTSVPSIWHFPIISWLVSLSQSLSSVRSCSNLQPNLSSSKCLSILDSTGNSTQYSVMIYLGTESKKERIYEYA